MLPNNIYVVEIERNQQNISLVTPCIQVRSVFVPHSSEHFQLPLCLFVVMGPI